MDDKLDEQVADIMEFIRWRERDKPELRRSIRLLLEMLDLEHICVRYIGDVDKIPEDYDEVDAVFSKSFDRLKYRGVTVDYHISFTDARPCCWNLYACIHLQPGSDDSVRRIYLPQIEELPETADELASHYHRLCHRVNLLLQALEGADIAPGNGSVISEAEFFFIDSFEYEIERLYPDVPRTSWEEFDISGNTDVSEDTISLELDIYGDNMGGELSYDRWLANISRVRTKHLSEQDSNITEYYREHKSVGMTADVFGLSEEAVTGVLLKSLTYGERKHLKYVPGGDNKALASFCVDYVNEIHPGALTKANNPRQIMLSCGTFPQWSVKERGFDELIYDLLCCAEEFRNSPLNDIDTRMLADVTGYREKDIQHMISAIRQKERHYRTRSLLAER